MTQENAAVHKHTTHTLVMPVLRTVAKQIAVRTSHEELCDPQAREHLAREVLANEGAWAGLPPQRDMPELVRGALADAAAAAQKSFGPGTRYRVVLEILVGTPHNSRIRFVSSSTELITD